MVRLGQLQWNKIGVNPSPLEEFSQTQNLNNVNAFPNH